MTTIGNKYDPQLSRKAIAANVRAEVKAAIKAGALPAGTRVSVSCAPRGSTIRARITLPFPATSLARVLADASGMVADPHGYWHNRTFPLWSPVAMRAMDTVTEILCAYRRDDSDIQTDYFNCNFYDSVELDHNISKERELLLAQYAEELADLRVAVASGQSVEANVLAYGAMQ